MYLICRAKGHAPIISKMKVYLIPGLGADHRLFKNINIPNAELTALDWPEMPEGSSLADYAEKLSKHVDRSEPFCLLGVSMGGMVALELARIVQPERTFLISSWKSPEEFPTSVKALSKVKLTSLINDWTMRISMPLVKFTLGAESKEDEELLEKMINSLSVEQMRIGAEAILSWKGCELPKELVHIHGNIDRVMPIDKIKDPIVVEGGGHTMVYNRAEEINKILAPYFL